jgi:hypothetical protein
MSQPSSFPRRVGFARPPAGNGHSLARDFQASQGIATFQRNVVAADYSESDLALRRQGHQKMYDITAEGHARTRWRGDGRKRRWRSPIDSVGKSIAIARRQGAGTAEH